MKAEMSMIEEEYELTTYAYSYPHKSSYRPLSPPTPISAAWQREDLSRLSLYVHIPFCEMRCGFCNLFTQSRPDEEFVEAYLATLARQARVICEQVPKASFRQFALGGGTPTFLSPTQLETVLHVIERIFPQRIRDLHASVEVSPATATWDRLRVLAGFGVERISIGVQSFIAVDARQIGRPQRASQVQGALEKIRACGFPVVNVDLIYGDLRQTRESWLASLEAALRYCPEELYLYPLYIRPDTGLARSGSPNHRHRVDLYLAARDLLGQSGYAQASLRCFRLPSRSNGSSDGCQRDGMIGLGCGARSYTRKLHYATRFAATRAGIRAILGEWIAQTDEELALATHGVWLSTEEQVRRYIILSLLQAEGLASDEFQEMFPCAKLGDFPEFGALIEREWLAQAGDRYVLTPAGLQNSDAVGPMLYSQPVRDRLRSAVKLRKTD